MYVEVSVAVNYLLSHLYTKLPRRRVDNFGEELERCLVRKLQPHWFVDTPSQDASQRCFQTSGPQADFLFAEAAISSGLDWSEIQACLPAGLIISIDPGYVACQYGSNECPSILQNNTWATNGFNSMSLSSSGCSSASSVSSNASSSGSWPTTKHQVLYTIVSKDPATTSQVNEKESEEQPIEFKKSGDDNHTDLATEAALSVLTEPDDIPSSTGFELSQSFYDIKSQVQNNEYNQGLSVSSSTSKQSNEFNQFSSESLSDGINMNALGQISKSFGQPQAPRCNESSTITMRNNSVNHFVPTDATGDGTLYENFTPESNKSSLADIESSFYTFTQKQIQPGVNPSTVVDGMGEHEYQQGPQSASQQNFNSTANFIQKSTSAPSFTAATFAATKFGSTKLKSQTKRPHRLVSPGETSNPSYPPQLLENIAQSPIVTSQICSSEIRRSGAYMGSNFTSESNRGYYGNYSGLIESGQQEMGNGTEYGGFTEGNSSYNNSAANNSGNNRGVMSNALLSQFEKIRNEFQMKHSQFTDPTSSEANMLAQMRSNLNKMPWYYTSSFNRKTEGMTQGFQTDIHQNATPTHINRAPGSICEVTKITPNSFIDDTLNIDLQDLWNSQKLGNSFCWPHDKPSPGLDTHIGQIFNGLNISKR